MTKVKLWRVYLIIPPTTYTNCHERQNYCWQGFVLAGGSRHGGTNRNSEQLINVGAGRRFTVSKDHQRKARNR